MKLFNAFIIALTKLVSALMRLLGRSAGTVPGRLALTLNKNILSSLTISGKIIVVTGTNGKTTTTNILSQVLQAAGHRVITNHHGNNINWGIATTLLRHAALTGRIAADYLVLETDEHWVPVLYSAPNLHPDTLIVLDFFRDQLDRAGEMETIIEKLEHFVANHPCNLILNGDDPNVVRIGRKNTKGKNYYYGFAELSSSTKTPQGKLEGIICPYCKSPLEYDFYQYSHLGRFHCPECDYQNHPYFTEVTKIKGRDFYVNINSGATKTATPLKFTATNPNIYNIYNLLAVLTCAELYHVAPGVAKDVFARYRSTNGRDQTFHIAGRNVTLNLCKNPTGCNVVLDALRGHHTSRQHELLFVINDHVNDGHDVSWLWDIDLTDLGGFSRIICSGTRAYDMAIPVKSNFYSCDRIIVHHDPTRAIEELLSTPGDKYIISNYSPLVEVQNILTKLEAQNG